MENSTLSAASFNFDSMVTEIGKDPFAANSDKYAADARFYKLQKDKEGKGGAVIRFLPDRNRNMIQQVYKINTTIEKNGKKRFVNELSPNTIGAPCPFQEQWQSLWNAGQKDESKNYGRAVRFYTNIKVIKDPANPANEGKIFILDMSGSLKDKIQKIVNPTQAERDLGSSPKELFNPIMGNSFRMVSGKGSNGIINYDASEALSDVTSIYNTVEEAFADIKDNTHDLSEFKDPATFLSYEKLQDKLRWVTFADAVGTTVTQVVTPVVAQVPAVAAVVVTPDQELNAASPQTVAQSQVQPEVRTQSVEEMLAGLVG